MVELNYTIVAAGHCRCPQRASKCALTDIRPQSDEVSSVRLVDQALM